jgi:hypothetical protein
VTLDLAPLLCLALTAIGLALTVPVARRRGPGPAVRLAGWSLMPTALALTGLLDLLGDVVAETAEFAVGLVFSPFVWLGVALFAVAAVLVVVGGRLPRAAGRGRGTPAAETGGRKARPAAPAGPAPPAVGGRADPVDDDLAEIEELLRRRGIT